MVGRTIAVNIQTIHIIDKVNKSQISSRVSLQLVLSSTYLDSWFALSGPQRVVGNRGKAFGPALCSSSEKTLFHSTAEEGHSAGPKDSPPFSINSVRT